MTRADWLSYLSDLNDEPLTMLTEPRQYNSLKHFGLYEKALLLTWVHHHDEASPSEFVSFFERANRKRLRAEGDRFTCDGKPTLYRGLSGVGDRRVLKGLSWTDNIAIATLFAYRWHGRRFYSVKPHLASRAADPMVYTVTIAAKDVLVFINGLKGRGKNEREYIVHPDSLPEPSVVEMDFETVDFNRCKYDWDDRYRLYKCPTVEEVLA